MVYIRETLRGLFDSPTHRSWRSMINRCYREKNDNYKNYGAKGITVCDRWKESFLNFYDDMGERPKEMTLDRIDVNGSYCRDNCRWATIKEQHRNRNDNVFLEYKGKRQTHAAWSEELGLKKDLIGKRLKQGFSIEESLSKTKLKRFKGNSRIVEAFGKKQTLAQWSRDSGFKSHTIRVRLEKGWSSELALTKPLQKRREDNDR